MTRTAPAPNLPPIPGMNPGVFVMGGGGTGGGGGGQKGGGSGLDQGADGVGSGGGASGGGKTAASCSGGGDGSGCPNHHGSKQSGKISKGDPVDVVTGRVFTDPVVDFAFLGPLGLRFVRRYSSAARAHNVGLGFGWTHSLAWSIEVRRNLISMRTATGGVVTFHPLEVGDAGVGPDGWVLSRHHDGFTLDDNAGSVYLFTENVGATYLLSAVLDAHGNATKLTYAEGKLETVEDAAGRLVRVRRHPDGSIAAFEAKNAPERGRWVTLHRYAYDDAGDLIADVDAEENTTRYGYDDHRLIWRIEPEGLTFHFRYDQQGRCVETWGDHADPTRLGLDDDVAPTLADGTKAKGIFHCRFEYGDDGYSEAVDSYSVHRYFGNDFGKVEKAVSGGAIYRRTYDEGGNLLAFTDPLGATTTWVRDGRGRTLQVTDPLGRTTLIEREPDGHIRRVVDAAGGVTQVERSRGRLRWVDPIGAWFEVTIDPRGLITETTAPNGAHTRLEYDAHGNLVRQTDALGARTEWAYDHWGRCLAVRDPLGNIESYAYNQRGDLMLVRSPEGGVTRYSYDRNGDIVGIEHPDGTATVFRYGGLRKLCETQRPQGERNQLRYDREGRLTRAENARGDTHRIRYDVAGYPIYERTFVGLEKHFRYDQAGRLLTERSAAGETTEFRYDDAGQLISRLLPDGTTESFDYDPCGRLVASVSAVGEFSYERNAVGWVVAERQRVGDETITIARTYDLMGNVSRRETSRGHRADFERDAGGRSTRVVLDERESVDVRRDALGREIGRLLPQGGQIQVIYDALGRMAERQVRARHHPPDGPQRWLAHPVAGAPAPELVGPSTPDTTLHQAFFYTPTSALRAAWSDIDGWRFFDHDAAGQLLGVRREQTQTERYAYDAAGNLHEPGGEGRAYGEGNRLMQKGDVTYQWDEAGRLVATRDGQGQTTHYTWNGLGLLASVEMPDGRRVEFAYDSFARRVLKRLFERSAAGQRLTSEVRFVWDGGVLVHEIKRSARAAGDPIVEERTYCFEDDRFAPWAHRETRQDGTQRDESPWYHYLNDEVGAPERLVGPDGQIVGALERTIWRASPRGDQQVSTPLRYPGQYEDEETGLVYNRYRYFDPALGRYISADPVDPDGLMPFTAIKNAAGKDPSTLGHRRNQAEDYKGTSALSRGPNEHDRREGHKDPAITEAVSNAQNQFPKGQSRGSMGDTPCSEVDALHQMARAIRTQGDAQRESSRRAKMSDNDVRAELQKRFRNGATIETTNDAGLVMAPCPTCAQIFRELGLHPRNIGDDAKGGIIGPNDKLKVDVNKMGRWDGTFVQSAEKLKSRKDGIATVPSSTPPFRGR
ncbi:MAG: DUF6531 domain-containing protein [Polyangiaceae bacterium]|nr:DUF6531 domain-containing protein [Polyangiaceae bacterium]